MPVALSVPSAAVLAEVDEGPCILKWWVKLVRFIVRVSEMPEGSLHATSMMCWMLLPSVLVVTGRPRSSKIFGLPALLPMLLGCQLTSSASPMSLLASNMMSGRSCMPPQGRLLPRAPSYACITGGSRALGLVQSPISTCPWATEVCAAYVPSGLGPTPRQLRWAGDCVWPMLRVCARCALACIRVMRGIVFPSVPLSRTSTAFVPGSLMT